MPYAIVMYIEKTSAPQITMLWRALAATGVGHEVLPRDEEIRFAHRPHVTLAVVDDAADPDFLVAALKKIVSNWTTLPILLDSIAILPRKPVLPMLARPNVTSELLKLNKDLCEALPSDLISSYHKPEVWQPHVTLARDILPEKIGRALETVLESWSSFETTLDQVALIHFSREGEERQMREIWSFQL